jgi:hypothetical protein
MDDFWQLSLDKTKAAWKQLETKPHRKYTIQVAERNSEGRIKRWLDMPDQPFTCDGLSPAEIIQKHPSVYTVTNEQDTQTLSFNSRHTSNTALRAVQHDLPIEEALDFAAKGIEATNTLAAQALKAVTFPTGAPVSVATVIKKLFVSNPNAPTLDYGPPIGKGLNAIGDAIKTVIPEGTVTRAWYSFLGFPDWFYALKNNAPARYALEVATMCGSLYVANAAYHAAWVVHMAENVTQLRSLLQAYQSTAHLPETDRDKRRVLKDLETFIAKGNLVTGTNIKSVVQQLFTVRTIGQANINFKIFSWMFTITNALLLWKLRHLRHLWGPARLSYQAGYMNGESLVAAFPVLFIGAYFSFCFLYPYTLVACVNAACVAQDVWTMGGYIKKLFIRKSTKKKEEEHDKEDENSETDTNTQEDDESK